MPMPKIKNPKQIFTGDVPAKKLVQVVKLAKNDPSAVHSMVQLSLKASAEAPSRPRIIFERVQPEPEPEPVYEPVSESEPTLESVPATEPVQLPVSRAKMFLLGIGTLSIGGAITILLYWF
jgi:hypothetical protein